MPSQHTIWRKAPAEAGRGQPPGWPHGAAQPSRLPQMVHVGWKGASSNELGIGPPASAAVSGLEELNPFMLNVASPRHKDRMREMYNAMIPLHV
jgi:hypothetical protein